MGPCLRWGSRRHLTGRSGRSGRTRRARAHGTVNDYDVRVVRTRGEFTRHGHPETDEFFLVLSGELMIRMDAGDVRLGPGEVYIVPKGVQHQPVSPEGATVLLFEPSATVNTGDTPSELTAERRVV